MAYSVHVHSFNQLPSHSKGYYYHYVTKLINYHGHVLNIIFYGIFDSFHQFYKCNEHIIFVINKRN